MLGQVSSGYVRLSVNIRLCYVMSDYVMLFQFGSG